MRTLGLLGGMSWESTTSYYQQLNRIARERLGGQHSAKLLIWSADFAPIAAMQAAGDWAQATAVLVDAARRLEGAGAEALLICANTMHLMAAEVEAAVGIPLLHVADATAAGIAAAGARRPLLLATRFTMERPFYRERLSAHGVEAIVPSAQDRETLHAIIFDELVQGRFEPASRRAVVEIARKAVGEAGADGVILGCTEFGLLVGPQDFPVPTFDTTEIHARAAMDFSLGADGAGTAVVLRRAGPSDANAICDIFLASRADALPYLPMIHTEPDTRSWFAQTVLTRGETWLAIVDGGIVGYATVVGDELDHLYLKPGHYRRGIGSRLLAKARELSPGGLHLYAFQRNARARAFYEARGFTVFDLNDGSRNEEGEPDVRYEWNGALSRSRP